MTTLGSDNVSLARQMRYSHDTSIGAALMNRGRPGFFASRKGRWPVLLLAALMPGWAQAGAPELVCQLRYGSDELIVRQQVSADPYAATAQSIGERFQFKAVVLGEPDRIDLVTLTVYDLSVPGAPVPIHHVRYAAPFNTHPALPALTGWNHIYSSVYGRELRYGCALQEGAAPVDRRQP